MRIPGTLFTIWFVRPCPMKPAPIMPTRIGMPCSSRARRALSTMIMTSSLPGSNGHPPRELRLDLGEKLPRVVLLRDLGGQQRPFQAEPGIGVHEPALPARGVGLSYLEAR